MNIRYPLRDFFLRANGFLSLAIVKLSCTPLFPCIMECTQQYFSGFLQRKMGGRGVIGDKWSSRVLWACAIGSVVSLYMVVVERQLQNRERMMAEGLKNIDAESGAGDNV
ncbi:hypothetical protein NC653_004129 [Populus alba x Populus x berolinensis]|nr:hypothetical protein NC653_004129 [Populus alba x Populus x berolinensis]